MVNDLMLLEGVMDSMTGRQKDPCLLVRVLALRGLGNIAVGAPEKVRANGMALVGSSGDGGRGGLLVGGNVCSGNGGVSHVLVPVMVRWHGLCVPPLSLVGMVGTGEEFLLRRVVRQWNGLPGGVVGVTVPGGGQEAWRCGTLGCGQWGWVGVGLGIFEVFSNPNASMMV